MLFLVMRRNANPAEFCTRDRILVCVPCMHTNTQKRDFFLDKMQKVSGLRIPSHRTFVTHDYVQSRSSLPSSTFENYRTFCWDPLGFPASPRGQLLTVYTNQGLGCGSVMGNSLFDVSIGVSGGSFTVRVKVTQTKIKAPLGKTHFSWAKPQLLYPTRSGGLFVYWKSICSRNN